MAETTNISRMAEMLSTEVFREFRWQQAGPMNVNWSCNETSHHSKTHPSDVVFFYDEPYSRARTYINCDLKSYAQGTINARTVQGAVESLAKAIVCAEKSEEWQDFYLHNNITAAICGLLFVYNHDGEYDRNFDALLEDIHPQKLQLPKKSKIVVLGPEAIYWLNNVRFDIVHTRGKGQLPPSERCQYFYPDLVRKKIVHSTKGNAATLEMLTSPWIILEYLNEDGTRQGVDVYYKGKASTIDEFVYLIDSMLHYNILRTEAAVRIKTLDADRTAPAFFQRAKHQIVETYAGTLSTPMTQRLDAISYSSIANIASNFSDIEIGMVHG